MISRKTLEWIEKKEIRFSAVRSRGPGGQNVNKVSSAALLQWDFEASFSLTEEQKRLIFEKLSSFINKEGVFYLRSDEYRDLERNKARCLEKWEALLEKAFFRPKKRTATKPTKASQKRRVEGKRKRSQTKDTRKKVDY
jgi:ribosome-associated protein